MQNINHMFFISRSLKNKIWVNEFRYNNYACFDYLRMKKYLTECFPVADAIDIKMSVLCNRYGGFSLGAKNNQFLSNKDEIDSAIAQLRRRFHLERVSDFITLLA